MVNSVTLINTTESVNAKIACYKIPLNWTNQTGDFPIPGNFTTIKPIQFNGWTNPTYTLQFVIYLKDNPSGFITWEEWMKIVKSSVPTKMNIVISGSDISFKSYATSATGTSDIYFQVINFNTTLDPSDNTDSNTIDITATVMESTI